MDATLAVAATRLADVGRKAVAAGHVVGTGGNLSFRDRATGSVVISASGTDLGELDEASFSVLDADGTLLGGHPSPSSERAVHLAAYDARPEIVCCVHLHPRHATLLHALGREIRLITLDHAYYVRSIGSVPYIRSGTQEVADAAAAALGAHDCVMLGHHGCVVVADDVGLAAQRAQNLEEAAAATYRALLLSDLTTVCPPAYMQAVRAAEEGS